MPRTGPAARALFELRISNAQGIIDDETGVWSSFRKAMGLSVRGLLWSLQMIVVGVLLIGPWAAAGWGVVKWRRGRIGYLNKPIKKLPKSFVLNVGLVIVAVIISAFAPIHTPSPDAAGVILSASIWPVFNASSEQLLWIYIFEAWDLRLPQKGSGEGDVNMPKKWMFRFIGLLLNLTFVGMIHVMYWAKFLLTVNSASMLGVLFVVMSTVTGVVHLWVWRESNQMVFTFIPHYILNLMPFFWTGYSLIPFLFRF